LVTGFLAFPQWGLTFLEKPLDKAGAKCFDGEVMKTIEHKTNVTFNGEEDYPVLVYADFSYDEGDYLEAGHPYNGHNKGWYLEDFRVVDEDTGKPIILDEIELRKLEEELGDISLEDC